MITELLHPTPYTKIMLVTSHLDELAEEISAFIAPFDGKMDVSLFPGEHKVLNPHTLHRTFNIKDFHTPAGGIPRDYAAVIVQDVLHLHHSPLKFLQLLYRTLLNACEIIIVQQKGVMSLDEIESLLDQAEFRAINLITDLIEGHEVIVGKKMHMWGNGL